MTAVADTSSCLWIRHRKHFVFKHFPLLSISNDVYCDTMFICKVVICLSELLQQLCTYIFCVVRCVNTKSNYGHCKFFVFFVFCQYVTGRINCSGEHFAAQTHLCVMQLISLLHNHWWILMAQYDAAPSSKASQWAILNLVAIFSRMQCQN